MITRRYVPIVLVLLMLVTIAFLFLTKSFDWSYITEPDNSEPEQFMLATSLEEDQVTLNIYMSVSEEQFAELERLNKEANTHYPHIHAKLTNLPQHSVGLQEWNELTALGKLGDIQLLPNEWIVPLAVQGLLQPVDRNMTNEALADQYVSLTDALKWNGYLWGVPFYINPYIMLTHKQLAEEGRSTSTAQSSHNAEQISLMVNQETSHQTEEIALYKQKLEQFNAVAHEIPYFINLDMDTVIPFWIWLNYWSSAEPEKLNTIGTLTALQTDMVKELSLHQQYILDASLSVDSRADASFIESAFVLMTFESFYKRLDVLGEYYHIDSLEVPYPWLNGSSFVISSQSKLGSDAIKWIEIVTQLIAAENSHEERIAIRPSLYNAYGHLLKYQVKEKLMQKLTAEQMMPEAPLWALRFEEWEMLWMSEDKLEQKLYRLSTQK